MKLAVPGMDPCENAINSFERVSVGICLSDGHQQLSKCMLCGSKMASSTLQRLSSTTSLAFSATFEIQSNAETSWLALSFCLETNQIDH